MCHCLSTPLVLPETTIFSARLRSIAGSFGRACRAHTAPRFRLGDSPTNTPGSELTLAERGARPFFLTAPTSPRRLTTACLKRFPPNRSAHNKQHSHCDLLARTRRILSLRLPATADRL